MSSQDDAKKTIGMIKVIGPWASVFLIGLITGVPLGWLLCSWFG